MNRKKFISLSSLAATAFVFPLGGCKKHILPINGGKSVHTDSIETNGLLFSKFRTDKGAYLLGNVIKLSFDIKNTASSSVTLTELHVFLKDISNLGATFTRTVTIANNITIGAGQTYSVNAFTIWAVPGYALPDAFGVYVGATLQGNQTIANTYATFFRVVSQSQLLNYTISNSAYQGLSIQSLDGGLSAEYTVGKAAEVLSCGVAHSWVTSAPGSGPNSVYSTPDFFDRAVNYTINYYNQAFGSTANFDTVIISTGVASIPYLSRVMKAPVLPLHFLASANTVKEIISILNYNQEVKNYATYSTLGYDGSIAMAVAWIKMLALPQQYIDFLNQHNVKNVVFTGTYGATASGENKAKKILYNSNPATGYNNGDLFLMYPQGGVTDDFTNLYNKLVDLHDYDTSLESNYRIVSDWESGVVSEQLTNFTSAVRAQTAVQNIRQLSAADSLSMYDLATYLTLTFMQKNTAVFTSDGPAVMGVAMNPYLLAHPMYESKIKYVPMLFWQGNSGQSTVDRLVNQVQQTIHAYFPTINFSGLNFWVNTSKNFGGYQAGNIQSALQAASLSNITMSDSNKDEVWNTGDGMGAICEKIATNILTYSSPQIYKSWDDSLSPLNPADLDALATRHSDIAVVIL